MSRESELALVWAVRENERLTRELADCAAQLAHEIEVKCRFLSERDKARAVALAFGATPRDLGLDDEEEAA